MKDYPGWYYSELCDAALLGILQDNVFLPSEIQGMRENPGLNSRIKDLELSVYEVREGLYSWKKVNEIISMTN